VKLLLGSCILGVGPLGAWTIGRYFTQCNWKRD